MATKITTRVLADNAVTDAKIADVTLTTATQSASDNTTKVATTAYVTTAIANLADSAPSTLNTLNELAAALGDDANFSTTVTNSIATKLPLAGGTLTGDVTFNGTNLYFNGAASSAGHNLALENSDTFTSFFGSTSSSIDKGYKFFTGNQGGDLAFTINADKSIAAAGALTVTGTLTSTNLTIADGVQEFDKPSVKGFRFLHNDAGNDLSIQQGDTNNANYVTKFNISTDGNIGIGTNSPDCDLHINGANNSEQVIITGGNTASRGLSISTVANNGQNNAGVIFNAQDTGHATYPALIYQTGGTERMRITSSNVLVGGTTDRGRKLVVEGTGDLLALYSTNTGAGGAQLDLIHDSSSYADGDAVGVVNMSTDVRQLGGIRTLGAVSGERGVFHIGVRKSSSEYNHNAMRLHNGGDEILLDIYAPSGSNRGAGYFRFKTDGASTEESVAQIYMEQGSGDGGSRKSHMYFQVADNGSPSTAMTIENNKYVSTATNLNVATSSPASYAKLNVNGGIRFTHSPASAAGLNVTTQVSINNTSSNLVASNLYYKSFFINFYHNNGHSQCFFVSNGGGGVGYNFTGLVPGQSSVITGTGIDQSFTTIGSSPNTFRVQLTSGGGQLYITRSNGSGSFQVSIQVLTGG